MLESYLTWLMEELATAGSSLLDLRKRVSLWYLLSAVGFAFVVFYWRYGKHGWQRLLPYVSPKVWLSRSSRTDVGLWLCNRLLLALLIPKTLTHALWISGLYYYWQKQGLTPLGLGWSTTWVMVLFTFCYVIADDFSRFFTHWCLHKIPVLWAFHQVHHSALVLTPFTVFRTHPVEGVLFFIRSLCVQSVLVSVFLVLFPNQVSLWQIYGVLVTTFLFNVLGANLRHSMVVLSYGPRIEKWLISPAQHQIHHSTDVAHYDRNFGVLLAIWDRLFKTWLPGNDQQTLKFGTGRAIDRTGVIGHWWIPMMDCADVIRHGVAKRCRNLKKRLTIREP